MGINHRDYPPNWKTEIRPRILRRAGYCCENCGVKQYTVGYREKCGKMVPIIVAQTAAEAKALRNRIRKAMQRKIIAITITIAHLKHNEWDHNVPDDDLSALCQKCHLDHDRVDNNYRKNYGKHYKRYQAELFPA